LPHAHYPNKISQTAHQIPEMHPGLRLWVNIPWFCLVGRSAFSPGGSPSSWSPIAIACFHACVAMIDHWLPHAHYPCYWSRLWWTSDTRRKQSHLFNVLSILILLTYFWPRYCQKCSEKALHLPSKVWARNLNPVPVSSTCL